MSKKILIISIIALTIDQITKVIASLLLKLNISKKLINNFFYLTLCHNEGAAWGLFSNSQIFIIIGTILALVLIYHFTFCFKQNFRNNIAFGLLYGGLVGNFIDRITAGYVIDFLDFYIFKYDFPVFNCADICIVIGVMLLIYAVIRGEDIREDKSTGSKRKTRQVSSK